MLGCIPNKNNIGQRLRVRSLSALVLIFGYLGLVVVNEAVVLYGHLQVLLILVCVLIQKEYECG